MEVKVGLSHGCEIIVRGTEDTREYVRIGDQLRELLEPYYAETFDAKALKEKVDQIMAPCMDYAGEVVFVEFLTSDHVESTKTLVITEDEFNVYRYSLPEDGLYVYYKVAIQKKEFLGDEYEKKIYYDNGKIMYKNQEIKDPSELVDYLTQTGVGILDYCEEPVFSLCQLEHCVFEVEKNLLSSGMKSCGSSKCDKNLDARDQRNFLFISLAVLRHLISEEKYDDAEEILEALSSCGSLCKNLMKTSKGCNCGTN